MKQKKIYIIDVTNRDGVQTANLGLAKLEKTMLNIYLSKMGVFQSEFGFPVTNHETNYLQANLQLSKDGVMKNMRLSGWARAVSEDVILSKKLVPELEYMNLSMSTSDQMIENKFKGRVDKAQIIKMAVDSVTAAKDLGIKEIGVNAEDASRSNID